MSASDHPESALPAATAFAPASKPQPEAPRTEPARESRSRALEAVLAALVLAFAFLAASFVARNADFWLDLAAGRLLSHGQYSFGAEPFGYTTAGVFWVNHAWLYDEIVYLLYREDADAWLVILKAAMIAVLAVFLLMIRPPGKKGWPPAFCTALAILAMSPRLLLQPSCVSFLLTGLTLWLLWSRRFGSFTLSRPLFDARIFLIPLCALWVNLDDWFLLGPLLAALFWIGDRMQPAADRPKGMRPTPIWLFPACLAACLCSPYHVFGFTLPADLFPLPFSGGLIPDLRFRLLFASPWQFDAALRSPAGANIAGLAYFVLVGLGVGSFVVNRSGLSDWRILVWVVFAGIGGLSVRLIPFFAIVGGPIAALNLQSMNYTPRPGVVLGLRTACVLFLLALIGLAVPGWLHGFHQKGRQLAWGVEIDPSMRRAAETLHRWREAGLLAADQRSFCLHPDAACYCAWFCPGEKSFLDARFSLFSGAADDYAAVCRGLDPSLAPGLPSEQENWRGILKKHGVAVVVLADPDPAHVVPVLGRMYEDRDEWTLLSVDGQAAIVGWNPAGVGSLANLRFDPGRLAFDAANDEAPAAPGRGPDRDPREQDWVSAFGRPPRPVWESQAAGMELRFFEDPTAPERREVHSRGYMLLLAPPAGTGSAGGPLATLAPLVMRTAALQVMGDKPPEWPLLAVRAARRAVAADPDDGDAYLSLAQAYLALQNETPERSDGVGLAPLAMMRHVQIVSSLRQALRRNPDLEAAHELLAELFEQLQPTPFNDVALDHRNEQLRLARRTGRGRGESAEQFQRRLGQLEAQVSALEKIVQDARNVCEIRFKAIGDDPLAKAKTALDLGLAGKALDDVLMKARIEVAGATLANRELELLLLMGRAREAKAMLDDDEMRANKQKLLSYTVAFGGGSDADVSYVFPTYEWLSACASSALGDYDSADAALQVTGEALQAEEGAGRTSYAASVAADVAATAGAQSDPATLAWTLNRQLQTRDLYRDADWQLRAERAGLLTLRALLDLERGTPEDAWRRLDESIILSRSVKESGGEAPGAALAVDYEKRLAAGH